MSDGITRRPGGTINPEAIQEALLTIPGITAADKMDLARTFQAAAFSAIEQAVGDQVTQFDKSCYVLAVMAAATLIALKECQETNGG